MEMKTQKVQYRISFFEPNSDRDCADFDGDTPFGAVQVGDRVMGWTWRDSPHPPPEAQQMVVIAAVTKIERCLARVGDVIHDVTLVYSKSLETE